MTEEENEELYNLILEYGTACSHDSYNFLRCRDDSYDSSGKASIKIRDWIESKKKEWEAKYKEEL